MLKAWLMQSHDNKSSIHEIPDEYREDKIDLSDVRYDDYPVFIVFWVLAFVVFLQFFTRYILNDSLGWTEEIARFLLMIVTFLGAVMAVRKQSHIAVVFLYRYVPRVGRKIAQTFIDIINVVFFGMLTLLTYQIAGRTRQMMVSLDVPKAYLYWLIVFCFAAMTIHAVIITWRHIHTGSSKLIDPELYQNQDTKID